VTYEEAVEQVARERSCRPEELAVCLSPYINGRPSCNADECNRIRELMALPKPEELANEALMHLDSGDVVAAQPVSNPKTLMGNMKVPNLSVVPFTGLIHEARAMQYGAFHAPRKDGKKGYGPFNWRDQKIEYLIYAEAAIRHIASAVDREDIDPDTGDLKVWHLGLAKATLGILIDAIEHGTVIDDRSPTACGRVAALLRELRKTS
jgi:hypothetical protein